MKLIGIIHRHTENMYIFIPGLTASGFLICTSRGGANRDEDVANASFRLVAASLRGGAGSFFS